MYDVLIIGGGVTGCAIARELSRYDIRAILLEANGDIACGATKANSAIVHGGYAESHSKRKGRLCYAGRSQFAALDRELGFGFLPIGSMVLAFDDAQRAQLAAMMENGIQNGVPDLALLSGEEIRAMEPHINPAVRHALYCHGAGVCSPFELAIALMENAMQNGVELALNSPVSGLARRGSSFAVTTADGRVLEARYVVNAAGLQADTISALAGDSSFKLHPRSGAYAIFARGSGSLARSVLFQMPTRMGKGILVTPTVYGNLLVGPDAIDEVKNDRNTYPERVRNILSQATLTVPDLPIRQFIRSFAGVRPVSDSDDFVIGPSPSIPGLIQAAGIQSPGLTASPAVARMVRDCLFDAGLTLVEKKDFDPVRRAFARPAAMDAAALSRGVALPRGAQGRIVCRCEQVAESAILDAASRGIPLTEVDAVKRRVRAGMGWCQGDFCRPRTAEILSGLAGRPIGSETDAARDGLRRVTREELLAYLTEHPL